MHEFFPQRPFIVAHYFSGVIVRVKNNEADLLRRPNASLIITGALLKITKLSFTTRTMMMGLREHHLLPLISAGKLHLHTLNSWPSLLYVFLPTVYHNFVYILAHESPSVASLFKIDHRLAIVLWCQRCSLHDHRDCLAVHQLLNLCSQ